MTTVAGIVLDPASIAAWLVVGLICGWVASKVMESPSYGMIGDIFLGSIGALAGGVLFGVFGAGYPEFWGSILVAVIGACILIASARAIAAARRE